MFSNKNAVSNAAFTKVYGKQDVIFNKAHTVCLKTQCDLDNDDEVLQIRAGEVFRKAEIGHGDSAFIKLVGNRGNSNFPEVVEGYIGKNELHGLNLTAIVTYATLKHPRYTLKKSESNELGTACGVLIKQGDRRVVKELNETDKRIISAFDLAQIIQNETELSFTKSFGGKNKEVIYKQFEITDQRTEPHKTEFYAAQIIFQCDQSTILSKRTYIESVSIVNLTTGSSTSFDPLGTPNDLYKNIGAPYMYSVNNSRQYFLLMNKLSEHFESRALAGFFLSEFNRSCKGKYRKTNDKCKHLAYEP